MKDFNVSVPTCTCELGRCAWKERAEFLKSWMACALHTPDTTATQGLQLHLFWGQDEFCPFLVVRHHRRLGATVRRCCPRALPPSPRHRGRGESRMHDSLLYNPSRSIYPFAMKFKLEICSWYKIKDSPARFVLRVGRQLVRNLISETAVVRKHVVKNRPPTLVSGTISIATFQQANTDQPGQESVAEQHSSKPEWKLWKRSKKAAK
jgi:hypothetical protein